MKRVSSQVWCPVGPFRMWKDSDRLSLFYLSSTSVSGVTTRRSKLCSVSFSSILVCTKLSSKLSFRVLYKPRGATSNPKQ